MGNGEDAAAGPRMPHAWQLGDRELLETVADKSAEIERLQAERVTLVGEVDYRCTSQTLGFAGTKMWLASTTLLEVGPAGRIVALGRGLRNHPEIADAFATRTISADHAALIMKFCDKPPKGMPAQALGPCRQVLLAAATGPTATTDTLRGAIAKLERIFESDEAPPSEDTDRNELHASKTLDGRLSIKGDVDAVTGDMLLAALSSLSMPRPAAGGTRDRRTPGQRRADAFTELLRRYLNSGASGEDGGERPHLSLHVNAADLHEHHPDTGHTGAGHTDTGHAGAGHTDTGHAGAGDADTGDAGAEDTECSDTDTSDPGGADTDTDAGGEGARRGKAGGAAGPTADRGAYADLFGDTGVAWTAWMGPLTIGAALRIGCDCILTTIVMDPDGAPIDLGRTARTISRKQRRALVARDCGCAFPGVRHEALLSMLEVK